MHPIEIMEDMEDRPESQLSYSIPDDDEDRLSRKREREISLESMASTTTSAAFSSVVSESRPFTPAFNFDDILEGHEEYSDKSTVIQQPLPFSEAHYGDVMNVHRLEIDGLGHEAPLSRSISGSPHTKSQYKESRSQDEGLGLRSINEMTDVRPGSSLGFRDERRASWETTPSLTRRKSFPLVPAANDKRRDTIRSAMADSLRNSLLWDREAVIADSLRNGLFWDHEAVMAKGGTISSEREEIDEEEKHEEPGRVIMMIG
jgi:hypothetical protein